jgi:serine/threonine-protein kinase HipA
MFEKKIFLLDNKHKICCLDNKQLIFEMKMAMSVNGKNKHYVWHGIMRRHWSSMSRKARFPEEELESIIRELVDPMDAVISSTASTLPAGFPSEVAEPIFSGMREAKLKIA